MTIYEIRREQQIFTNLKICRTCKTPKSLNLFHKNKAKWVGRLIGLIEYLRKHLSAKRMAV